LQKVEISLDGLLQADFAVASVLISFGALIGKVTPLQLLSIGFLEVIIYAVNQNILMKLGALDIGGMIMLWNSVFGKGIGRD